MACYHPITGWRSRAGKGQNGSWAIVFNPKEGYLDKEVTIPCGQCIGCRLERSRQWAIRMVHESSMHDSNSFVTLTYNDDHLPDNNSLNKTDMQKFLKRLRKRYQTEKIRFFQCGEYGENFARPHHHLCLFGFDFTDKYLYFQKNGYKYYRSPELEKLWTFGNTILTDLTFESAAYTARYCTKKITGKNADSYYGGRLPEYVTMSRRSGIGKEFWDKFKRDIIIGDRVVIRNDMQVKPAKYYDQLFHVEDPAAYERTKNVRIKRAKLNATENTYQRLAVKEKIQQLRFKELKRSYENGT